ncbi:hypothetical protein [Streptomyces sp. NPDC006270]
MSGTARRTAVDGTGGVDAATISPLTAALGVLSETAWHTPDQQVRLLAVEDLGEMGVDGRFRETSLRLGVWLSNVKS